MKQFLSGTGSSATISSHPVNVNGQPCEKITVSRPDYDKIRGGKHTFSVDDKKKITFTEIPPSPKKLLREELKRKLEAGTATQEDKDNALKLLL